MQQNKAGEPKLFKRFGHFSVALLLSATTLYAQSFADFKRGQQSSFSKYKDENDNAFAQYLEQQWKEYNAYKGTPLYEKEKPKDIAPAPSKTQDPVGPTVFITLKEPPKDKEKKEIVLKPKDISFDFFGTQVQFDKPAKIDTAHFSPRNKEGIKNFFHTLASSQTAPLIESLQQLRKDLVLNDWGLYLLVKRFSDTLYADPDASRLLSWYLFNKLGYATKVGISGENVVLLHASKKTIYATPSYSIGGQKFYALSYYNNNNNKRLYSYEQEYPGATKDLDLSLEKLPNFQSALKKKSLQFKNYADLHTIEFAYNQNLIDFFATYPQAEYDVFFNTPLDPQSTQAITGGLKKIIDGKKASEAMNIVLRFVQTAFDYKRDQEQFGKEKVMFAQETLYYDSSDCEDRATLFAFLIKELFGVGVVGVKYKDHMATALEIPLEGDKVSLKTKEYVVADPTYINANIGQSMPKYRSVKPQSFVQVYRK